MDIKKSVYEKGQAIVLIVGGIAGLLAFVALALDGGMLMYDRRSAQNAADSAALAGAYMLAHNPWITDSRFVSTIAGEVQTAALARAHDNNYGLTDGKLVTVTYPADMTKVKPVGSDNKAEHYIQVEITSTVSTSFIQMFYGGPVRNTVTATAHVKPPVKGSPFKGSGLVSLAPHGCGMTYVSGNLEVNLVGGGMFVNSDDDCALDGASSSTFVYTPALTVVGDISSNLTVCTPGETNCDLIVQPGPPNTGAEDSALPYPPGISLDPPPTCSSFATKDGTIDVDGVTYDKWKPGKMESGIPNGNIYFTPGIYCISVPGGGTNINNGQHLYNDPNDPQRVLLVFKGVSGSNPCNVHINGQPVIRLKGYGVDGDYGDAYKGILIYVDYGNWSMVGEQNKAMIFNGDSTSYINGTVYAPTCYMELNGTGQNFYQGQMVGYQMKLLGGAMIGIQYVVDDNVRDLEPSRVDLAQ